MSTRRFYNGESSREVKGGRVLDRALIEKLSSEAERGCDLSKAKRVILREGRPARGEPAGDRPKSRRVYLKPFTTQPDIELRKKVWRFRGGSSVEQAVTDDGQALPSKIVRHVAQQGVSSRQGRVVGQ